jgi:uncharacterized protein YndB with AHSA1/START domain
MRRACESSVTIASPPEAVWAVVSDVTRVGEWSGECRGCDWVGDADAAVPGARFRGRNRRGGFRWTRLNEVVLLDEPHELVWRTVPSGPYPDSVEWRLHLREVPGGTLVNESFTVLKMPRIMETLLWIAAPWHRDRTADLADDLERLKAVVERSAPTSGRAARGRGCPTETLRDPT